MIVGGGFAGASAARRLERLIPRQAARLVLVNDVNFLLYTPFLPEAAAGTLEPRHVVTPLRDILRRTYLRLGAVTGHDPAARTVQLTSHEDEVEELRYDQLLLALGSVSRLLPVPGLAEHAVGFKSLADAIWLRNHIVETLEAANASEHPARREEMLTYVFVGGGYAGVEALAELEDMAKFATRYYDTIRPSDMRWVLVEATGRILPEVDEDMGVYTVHQLRARGIEVYLETRLESAVDGHVKLSNGVELPCNTLVWTAGVKPHPVVTESGLPLDDRSRVKATTELQVEGLPGHWTAGDCAAAIDSDHALPTLVIPIEVEVEPAPARQLRPIGDGSVPGDVKVEQVLELVEFVKRHRKMMGDADPRAGKSRPEQNAQLQASLVARRKVPDGTGRPVRI